MPSKATLVWFRQDLRLEDNPALARATQRGGPVVPVYIWAPEEEGGWSQGGASRWWLKRSLSALDAELTRNGSRLVLRQGPSVETLRDLVRETEAEAVYWNRRYEPAAVLRDSQVEVALRNLGTEVKTFNSALLFEPWEVAKEDGTPYQVFTSFWRRCLSLGKPVELDPRPSNLGGPRVWPESDPPSWDEPRVPDGTAWAPGSKGAKAQLARFLNNGLIRYDNDRDLPGLSGTSTLSPHLHFGEIGPRQILQALQPDVSRGGRLEDLKEPTTFIKELGWREFAHHLLHSLPHTIVRPLRPEFEYFPWRDDANDFEAWQNGQTGYPLVDAGMRQLKATGWLHNRVRMVVASFLVKHLLLPWQEGARWFWDTLVDADLANNTLGWQWTAGSGADAAPYFRIFSPMSQGEKFDAQGAYVRRWVPELAAMPDKWIHRPWEAPKIALDRAGIRLGKEYPSPVIDHKFARQRALDAFQTVRGFRQIGTK